MLVVLVALALAAPPSYEDQRISIDVQNARVTDVLRLLVERAPIDLVVSEAVRGRITVKLRDVRLKDALQVVLRSRGLGAVKTGRILEVDTLERLNARAEAELARRARLVEAGRLVTRIIPLSYARAADLAPIVQSVLSERGTVTVDVRTNTLIVTDVAEAVDAAERLARGPR